MTIHYSPELGKKICDGMAAGRTLVGVCKEPGMPHRDSVYRWLNSNEEFYDMYTRARRIGLDHMIDDVIEIADNLDESSPSFVKGLGMKAKLQVDSRKWYICKVAPKIPSLSGSYADQAKEITEAYGKGDLNEERATTLMQLLNAQANFVCLDEFKKEIESLKVEIKKSHGGPK